MSLDVSLILEKVITKKGTGVFFRDNGGNRELTFEEVKEKFPDSNVKEFEYLTNVVFKTNITHNLNEMAEEAGIYEACWRPEEIGAVYAKDIIPILESGYEKMKNDPEYFKKFDSSNGWGTYDQFLPWIFEYLNACRLFPDAIIEVDR